MTTEDQPKSEENSIGPDEAFCIECGSVVKKKAEICPECGVRQKPSEVDGQNVKSAENVGSSLTEQRQYELEKIAGKNTSTIILVSLFVTPLGYWMLGKTGLAIVNFVTFNYFLLGPIVVPIHCYQIIQNAEDELHRAGVAGY